MAANASDYTLIHATNAVADDEDITFADPTRPNVNFGPFINAVLEQAAVGLGLSYEVLVGHYTASYSAARAAEQSARMVLRKNGRYESVRGDAASDTYFQAVFILKSLLSSP